MKTRFTLSSSKLPDRHDPYFLVPRHSVGVRILCGLGATLGSGFWRGWLKFLQRGNARSRRLAALKRRGQVVAAVQWHITRLGCGRPGLTTIISTVTLRTDVRLVKQLDCYWSAIPREPKLVEPLLSLIGRRAGNFYAVRDG